MSMSLRPSITPWGGGSSFICNPSWMFLDFNENLRHSFTYIADMHLIFYTFVFVIFNFFAFPLFQWNFYVKTSGGTHLVSTTPPKSVGRFQWKFQTFFYIHWRCTPKGYANAIWDLIIFNCFGFPYWKMDFVIPYLRGYPSLIHYPSLTCEWISMKHV